MSTSFKLSLAGMIALALAACNGQPTQGTAPKAASGAASAPVVVEKTEISFGTTPGDFGDMVKDQIKPALEKQGYKVTLTEFPDYVTPNKALAEKNIDINVFQHKPYLDSFKAEHKLDLTEVFQVPTAPLGIYAGKLSKLADVKDGSTVAVPNDPSNFARALVMMNELGWLKLKDGIDPLKAAKTDIAENTKNIKLVEMEAANLPRSRQDVDFAVVNGNYAMSSGMKLTDALFQEPSFAYVNWAVVRTADKDSKWVKDIAAAYASDEFKNYAKTKFAGYKFPAAWGEQAVEGAKAEAASVASASGTSAASAPAKPADNANANAVVASAPAQTASTPAPAPSKAADVASVSVENGIVKFYFASGKSVVAAGGDKALAEAVEAAKAGKKLVISGFTDSTGNAAANAKLSLNRAQAVRALLLKQGVKAESIELRKPESTTGAQGNSAEGRRVEVKIEG